MKKSQIIPFCYACGRVEDEKTWVEAQIDPKSQEVYETICRDCLVQWTNHLIDDVNGENKGKVA